MARSLNSIRMDFAKALRQARELEEVAGNMRVLADNKMEGTLQSLGQNWTGENAQKYIGKARLLEEKISRTSDSIADAARVIREIAQVVYEAEMRAWEIAHNRD